MPGRRLFQVTILASIFIIGSLALNSCTSVESVTISNIGQADSTYKTKVEVVLDGEIDKTQVAEFVESFGTAVAEGETLTFVTPTNSPPPNRRASRDPHHQLWEIARILFHMANSICLRLGMMD